MCGLVEIRWHLLRGGWWGPWPWKLYRILWHTDYLELLGRRVKHRLVFPKPHRMKTSYPPSWDGCSNQFCLDMCHDSWPGTDKTIWEATLVLIWDGWADTGSCRFKGKMYSVFIISVFRSLKGEGALCARRKGDGHLERTVTTRKQARVLICRSFVPKQPKLRSWGEKGRKQGFPH